MYNKVVMMVECVLCELGLDIVCFNFCGIGVLEGIYDEGNGEGDDLVVVVGWVCCVCFGEVLWLVGFFFGSYVIICNVV